MPKSTLILEDLKDALQHWEDVNMYSDVLFQLSNLMGIKEVPQFYARPLPGTEIDKLGIIRRGVNNFRGFRHLVENHMKINDPSLFVPRVPKEQKDHYLEKVDFFRRHVAQLFCFFPFMLSRWVEYKKVFVMDNFNLIQPVDISKENYLDKLPYDSFIIKLNEPVKIFFQSTAVEREFGTIIVSSDGTIVDLFFIPNNIKDWCLPLESRKSLQTLSFKRTKDLLKQFKKIPLFNPDMRCEGFSLEVESGFKWMGNAQIANKIVGWAWDLSKDETETVTKIDGKYTRRGPGSGDSSEVLDIFGFQKNMANILNGFCKFISEIPPQQRDVVLGNSNSTSLQLHELTEWNAIPITNVFYLHERLDEGTDKKVLILSHGGGEKPPHWRRKHKRTCKSGKVIWIEKTFVRLDKLESENLKGSAGIVKDRDS